MKLKYKITPYFNFILRGENILQKWVWWLQKCDRYCVQVSEQRGKGIKPRKIAFTLAEVLVTITVIGAIAAMTLPNLNTHFKRMEYSARLKTFVNGMDNAIQQMEMEKGSFKDVKMPKDYKEATKWYLANIDPYFGHSYVKGNVIYFKNGSTMSTGNYAGCWDIAYDLNGKNPPNTYGIDKHYFMFCFSDNARKAYCGDKNIFFCPYKSAQKRTREVAKNLCKNSMYTCLQLLEMDGWEFKPDYPRQIR